MSRAAMEIFCRNNGHLATAEARATRRLRCTYRGWPEKKKEGEGAGTKQAPPRPCALHQLGEDEVPAGTEARDWPWPWRRRKWVTEVVVPMPWVHGPAAFAGYMRWRRAVTMRTRFFLEHHYGSGLARRQIRMSVSQRKTVYVILVVLLLCMFSLTSTL